MRITVLTALLASTLFACTGGMEPTDAEVTDATDVEVATDANGDAIDLDAGPIACGSMTCGATQVCVRLCGGGADTGTSGPEPVCMEIDTTCRQHACTCSDGYCGSQSYSCGYPNGREVRCMCA